MQRLTEFVLRHKLLVVILWVLAAGVGVATLGSTTNRLSSDFALPGQPGYVADQTITTLYHNGGGQTPTVLTVTAPSAVDTATADRVFTAAAHAVPGTRIADGTNTGDTHFRTADGRTAFALVFTPPGGGFGADTVSPRLLGAAAKVAPPGWHTGLTGLTQLSAGNSSASKGTSTLAETMLGAVGALAVLAFVFGSLLALLPLLMALVTIPATFLLIDGLTYLTPVSMLVEFLVALIGLGVAIDYALLVVTRWREERDNGADNATAVRNATSSAGRAVVFSGLTVAISLLAVLVVPVPFLRNMAVAGFLIPLVSIAVAITLLPVLLATVGPRIDRPRLRHEVHASRGWTAWARFVLRHRRVAAIGGGGLLLALLIPLSMIRLGEPETASLAQSGPAHAALSVLQDNGIPSGVLAPMEILTRVDAADATARALSGVPGVYAAVTSTYHSAGTAIVDVLPVAEPSSSAGTTTTSAVQQAAHGLPGVLGVGGAGPTQNDFIHAVYGSFPLMLGVIALLTLILLTRAFRSIVLAVKAVVFNLLSVSAAYGVMVLVWQFGFGSNAVWGIPSAGSITIWVPIMVFAFLFGLSMDYEVFILARMREEYDRTGATDESVITGIGRTGRLVTSAALILFLSFVSMSTAPGTDLKVLATGLGAGILLDALVLRCLLLPALVGLMGRWNWWLPTWLARLLRVAPSPLVPNLPPTPVVEAEKVAQPV
ncbi:MAG TPA: MMPL family transporter [Pseudonocardiaceae bacterium]|nr:MMPL family transporter [Pseudonocardiaceae bacterium]